MERCCSHSIRRSASDDELNAIFRAAHSIKGGAGTFGFRDVAEVTHVAGDAARSRAQARDHAHHADGRRAAQSRRRDQRTARCASQRRPADDAVDARDLCAARDPVPSDRTRYRSRPRQLRLTPDAIVRVWKISLKTAAPAAADRQPASASFARWVRYLPCICRKLSLTASRASVRVATCWSFRPARSERSLPICSHFIVPTEELTIEAVGDAAAPVSAAASDASGYGFFTEIAPRYRAIPVTGSSRNRRPWRRRRDAGFGFFDDAAGAPAPASSPGRRVTDSPEVEQGRSGRRATDKVVVSASGDSNSIRVGVDKVDQLINLVGELVITQAMLDAGRLDARSGALRAPARRPRSARAQHARPAGLGDVDPHVADRLRVQPLSARGTRGRGQARQARRAAYCPAKVPSSTRA